MPVISVSESRLHEALGKKYTENEFQDLCFNFGIELDEVTSPRKILEKQYKKKGKELTSEQKQKLKETSDEPVYKIEIAANRYDLLCEEGLFRALRIFTGLAKTPAFKTTPAQLEMHVKAETKQIREFVVCAVLRGIKFDPVRYENFISLQDKLHQGVARKRTLVAIGTHDLDTVKAPFSYEAQKPEDIKFVALTQTEAKNANELLTMYEEDPKFKHLKPYVPIIKGKERYPVIYDSQRNVLSLPPIINGDLSKITLDTKNVFIECTGTDRTKCYVVLNMMVTMFSEYTSEPFTVEQVKVVYPDSSVDITPNLGEIEFSCSLDYINRSIGCNISLEEAITLLEKMQLSATEKDAKTLSVKVPPTRSDVLHPCDIMEDVAIAFGYNKIPRTTAKTATFGKQDPLNHFTDLLRLEMAMAGFTEILTFALCSNDDNFKSMNKVDDEKTAVKIDNAKTADFQTVRISLLPGLLKTLEQSISKGVPLQLFEISDVVLKDNNTDIGCRNSRKLAAAYCGHTGNLEFIHGTLDRLMEILEINWNTADGYSIQQTEDSSFFPGRVAKVLYRGKQVGVFGLLHPAVLANFNITYPVSVLELDVEAFL